MRTGFSAGPDNACLRTDLADSLSLAPRRCATCTENPVAAALHVPQKSHVVVDTNPMEAAASAPSRPTMAASMYCMAMAEICATMLGMLNSTVRRNCCRKVIGCPLRMSSSRLFLFSVFIRRKGTAFSPYYSYPNYGYRHTSLHVFPNSSQASSNDCMEGNSRSAPASSKTWASKGPVLTAMVKMPAAWPACTPIGAFSTTTASWACTPAFCSPIR